MGSLPIEPEDFDLNTQKLFEQQRRVLEAQQKVLLSSTTPGPWVSRCVWWRLGSWGAMLEGGDAWGDMEGEARQVAWSGAK